jgi:hypothetical protein
MSYKLIPGEHYYMEKGFMVYTEKYHLRRGFCCKSGCRHCPWKAKKVEEKKDEKK